MWYGSSFATIYSKKLGLYTEHRVAATERLLWQLECTLQISSLITIVVRWL